jgi:E3 ubiquitin-protein ligase RAD18
VSSSNSNDISASTSISKLIPVGTPLPKLNYAMYNESKLRSMLAEQGLSTIGNKALLSARHKEFVNLHNANIDRRYPLSRQEILKQLEIWDATVSRQEKRKELDGVEWGRKFGNSFADLTKLARESMKRRKIGEGDDGEGTKTGVTSPSSQGETVT